MSPNKLPPLLVVEDDPALQKQIKWSLDRFESVTAHDRESAMAQVRRHAPSVVTMDLGLPPDADSVSEGFALLEQIMATSPDTKVIVLTGQNDQSNALTAVALGAYDFLAKPFEPEVLNLGVERAFRLHQLQAENKRLRAMQLPDALSWPTPTPVSCCWARVVRARKSWRVACTSSPTARAASSWPSIAPRFPKTCWKVSCLATRRARSPAQ